MRFGLTSLVRASSGAMLLGLAAASPGIAATPTVPPLLDPPMQERHPGKQVFYELVTPDLAAEERFYSALLGWTFHEVHFGRTIYADALLDGHSVAGMVQKPPLAGQPAQPAWLSFISAADVDTTVAGAVRGGAKVLLGPLDIPNRGRQAVLSDPQGVVFGVLASSSGDPPDVLADPGEWIWSSLITTDPDTDVGFYQTLFGYEVFELPAARGAEHLLMASENYARATANSIPANKPGLRPHWLSFVRVESAARMSANAAALGGRVLVAPRPDRHGGELAVVADPQGGVFGLLEWVDKPKGGKTR